MARSRLCEDLARLCAPGNWSAVGAWWSRGAAPEAGWNSLVERRAKPYAASCPGPTPGPYVEYACVCARARVVYTQPQLFIFVHQIFLS